MVTNTTLIQKREELKRQLATGEYETLIDFVLAWFERLLRKISRRTKPLPLWAVAIALSIVIQLISFSGIFLAGDWSEYARQVNLYGFGYRTGLLINSANGFLFVISLIVINSYIGRLVALWKNNILDITETETGLDSFTSWLNISSNWRLHLFALIIPNVLVTPWAFSYTSTILGISLGYGIVSSAIIQNIIAWAIMYQILMVILLSERLRRYDMKLFPEDPSSSEIISRLSGELGFIGYYIAFFAGIITFAVSLLGLLPSFGVGLVLILWLPIILLFIFNQISLSSIVRRAKWKTISEAQAKIEKIRDSENFGNQETMDAIKRLMDYHDRVKATRDSALDFRTYLSFINSLLLPLLGFILGNLDLVLKLLGIQP